MTDIELNKRLHEIWEFMERHERWGEFIKYYDYSEEETE